MGDLTPLKQHSCGVYVQRGGRYIPRSQSVEFCVKKMKMGKCRRWGYGCVWMRKRVVVVMG